MAVTKRQHDISNTSFTPNSSKKRRKLTKRVTILPKPPRPKRRIPDLPFTGREADGVGDEVGKGRDGKAGGEQQGKLQRLREIVDLLQKIHVRNKNQHGGQGWWKGINGLRRALWQLLNVCVELERLSRGGVSVGDGKLGGVGGRGGDESGVKAVRARFEREAELRRKEKGLEEWIREVLVPEAYVAGSKVVSDGQFAMLGVVLVALVGDVVGLVGMPKPRREDEGRGSGRGRGKRVQAEVGVQAGKAVEVLGRRVVVTGRSRGEDVEERYSLEPEKGITEGKGGGEDIGEVVKREVVLRGGQVCDKEGEVVDMDVMQTNMLEGPDRVSQNAEITKSKADEDTGKQLGKERRKKPKKGKKNAIDDIFAGF